MDIPICTKFVPFVVGASGGGATYNPKAILLVPTERGELATSGSRYCGLTKLGD